MKQEKVSWSSKDLKEFVCRIIPTDGKKMAGYQEFTQVIWALSPEDAEYRLRGWKQQEYDVKFMYELNSSEED